MAKRLIPNMNKSVSFTYDSTKITLGPLLWNPYFECWIMGYTDSSGVSIKSIPVRAGTNILQNYNTKIPALFAINTTNLYSDPTINFDFDLYVIDGDDLEKT